MAWDGMMRSQVSKARLRPTDEDLSMGPETWGTRRAERAARRPPAGLLASPVPSIPRFALPEVRATRPSG